MFHTLYYLCYTELQNHILHQTGKPHTLIHLRPYPIVNHRNHYTHFDMRLYVGAQMMTLGTIYPKQVQEFEYHNLVQLCL